MSIKVMTSVWEQSKQENGRLLLLLALADHANDDGVCWPSILRLAQRIRRKERQTKRLVAELMESGELFRVQGVGRGNTNLYLVTVGFRADELFTTLVKHFEFSTVDAQGIVDGITAKRNGVAVGTILPNEEPVKGVTDDTIAGDEKV